MSNLVHNPPGIPVWHNRTKEKRLDVAKHGRVVPLDLEICVGTYFVLPTSRPACRLCFVFLFCCCRRSCSVRRNFYVCLRYCCYRVVESVPDVVPHSGMGHFPFVDAVVAVGLLILLLLAVSVVVFSL